MVRKKQALDGIDREILRTLLSSRPLVTRRLAFAVGLTPAAVVPRLEQLEQKGILVSSASSYRTFSRVIRGVKRRVKVPQKRLWDLDLVDDA